MPPTRMPGEASGRVTLNSRSRRPAPSVRAASSRPRSAASRDRRMARTITGNVITPAARLAPAVVNTNRTPNQSFSGDPIGPRTPKMIRSNHPVTTGGKTRGRCTKAFSTGRPGNRKRASTQAITMASGKPNPTALAATCSVSRTASHSSGVSDSLLDLEAALLEDCSRLGACEEGHQGTRFGRIARLHHGEGIRHGVMTVEWEDTSNHHTFRYRGIRRINDSGRRLAALNQKHRASYILGTRKMRRHRVPDPQLLQRLFSVDADGHVRRITSGNAAI